MTAGVKGEVSLIKHHTMKM